ncbi:hypothetical protein ACH3XW_0310 [Acanthocheilonema viteae]
MEEQRRNDNSECLKEQNHTYARRMITTIAVVLTVLAIVLVTLSLLLGSRIDQIGINVKCKGYRKRNCYFVKLRD